MREEDVSCEKPNRLAQEKSPYLRQHACNPVDWRPWGPQTLREARESDKPLFISIGYSSCHWCHVMEREVFSDSQVAEVLNRVFINVKVDREEHPDVDQYYMTYCQIAGRGCGWPLNVFALPDGTPFYTFTYANKMQMLQLALSLENTWRNNRQEVIQAAQGALHYLEKILTPPPASKQGLDDVFLRSVRRELERSFDKEHGGFGYRPKFPMPHALVYLTRQSCIEPEARARLLDMVKHTLDSILMGGVYDLVGGGIHRYSVDEQWLVPHFEKMLYDQAGLVEALVEAHRATGEARYLFQALEVTRFLEREMWSGKAFYSSIDADAGGEEGLYYTFTLEEVGEALGDEELLHIATRAFNIRRAGNYLEEYTELPNGRNIIRLTRSPRELAAELGMQAEGLAKALETIRRRLREYREKHKPRPSVDTKTLVDWNMMTIASLTLLHRAAGAELPLRLATTAYDHLWKNARTGGVMAHQPGEKVPAPLDDQAHTLRAQQELYQITLNPRYLEDALELAHELLKTHVKDDTPLFLPPGLPSPLSGRPADSFDSPYASSVAILAEALWRLGHLTGDKSLSEKGEAIVKRYAQRARKYPAGHIGLGLAVQRMLHGGLRLVITSPPGEAPVREFPDPVVEGAFRAWRGAYAPFLDILSLDLRLPRLPDPSLDSMKPACGSGVTFYLCWRDRCDLPQCSVEKVVERLKTGACSGGRGPRGGFPPSAP